MNSVDPVAMMKHSMSGISDQQVSDDTVCVCVCVVSGVCVCVCACIPHSLL